MSTCSVSVWTPVNPCGNIRVRAVPDYCQPSRCVYSRNSSRKTSAEIVSEARQSLRVQTTQRPFTPRDGHRQLFGNSSVRGDHVNRPQSTFSLDAQNFDAPDSRPGSGTRLSPLEHKPKFPGRCGTGDACKAVPKPPADPLNVKRGSAGAGVQARVRLLRTGSLPTLPPLEGNTDELGNGDNAACPEESADSSMWNNTIGPLLQQLESVAAGGSAERLCDLCDRLHGTLAEADMLGRHCKRRSGILRTLFRLIDHNSARLNLLIAKLCLALCVSGNNLLNICKLVFQISRSESNDILFQNNSIIDLLLSVLHNEDVSTCGEALLYCVGTLKFLSGNSAILRLLLDKNCIGVAQKLIQGLHAVEEIHFTIAGHILVQDLVVRLLFTLGNLTAKNAEARLQLFQSRGCMHTLLQVYDSYQRRDASLCTPSQTGASSPGKPPAPPASVQEDDDVLVKLVRVLANMCIHPAVGPALANDATCIQLLMETLELRSVQESEELLVNVAATINNLSFYQEQSSVLRHSQLAITKRKTERVAQCDVEMKNKNDEMMLKLVLSSSMDSMLEATRVYGNMSKSKDVRDFIMQNKVHQLVVTLLDSKSTEMCFSACGVLTNLALDPPNRASLSLEGAAAK
ncbi:hypothetical protein F2P81_024227 [Scophthalmus maximus]|uniref:Armadillo repeat-containing protein 2 n=1 Tax=Scophthalmus maximus TaxID=52904 RepID=A0A6A4RTF2_SCOMX|nr:hypothetical protein F2P81_024227 [Scophthalmus maximus]